ncbi:MAG: hypothetical protein QS748_06390 [Candidatus Endonucleobacter bathymodioli]|uniref:RAP domain-containing protein n=1 Tax=Candidatus Endonucleibacter bathymodioli TaxID=539814 RepID=A0AA90NV58_9GAMM|nr:hypothetical protein [Candidatus Endonucleobacter bathymodioli]
MMLLHVILIRFIFIISNVFLFSYNVYAVYNKDRVLTLNSSKTDCNTSHNVSSSVKFPIKPKPCVYNTKNRNLISIIIRERHNKQQRSLIHDLMLEAIEHPADCLLTHEVDNVIIFFTVANIYRNYIAISKLADQLAKGETGIENQIWNCHDIWHVSAAIPSCSSSNISYIRQIIANKIVQPNNDMSKWKSYNITNACRHLIKGTSNEEAKAFEHIVNYVNTKNCNIYTWEGNQLSRLFSSLAKSNTNISKIAMHKVFATIIKSKLLYWNAPSTSTIFRSLVKLQKSYSSDIHHEEQYKIVLQLIIDHLASPQVNFRGCTGNDIAAIMKKLWYVSKLHWPKNIDKARQNVAKFIVKEDINIAPLASDDWMIIIRGLTNASWIEQEAIRTIAGHFNDRKVSLSRWTDTQLLNMATAFYDHNGRRIEKAIQKISNFIASKNLDAWKTGDLATLTKVLSPRIKNLNHKAIDNIAGQMLSKSRQWHIAGYISLVLTVSICKGDNCLKLIRYISNTVRDDSFYLSRHSPIFLAKLLSIVSQDDEKYAEKPINKITDYLISLDTQQWLHLSSESLKLIINACSKHYKLTAARSVLIHISHIVIDEKTDLSDWPIETMEVLLRTLHSSYDDDLIQRVFRKIVSRLNLPDTELKKWSIKTLACVAKGASRLRDYSSEKFIARLVKMYMKKRDNNESIYGTTMLLAICHLPIKSRKIIKASVKLASVLSQNIYSDMEKTHQLALFWSIILLDFVVHEEGSKINHHVETTDMIVELKKIIPEIDQDTIKKPTMFLAEWQLEFMSLAQSDLVHKSKYIHSSTPDNRSASVLEENIYRLIKTTVSGLSLNKCCLVNKFPIDLLLKSRSKSLLVEVDGPHHFFKGSKNRLYRLAKDRFVDFIFEKQLGHTVMRINYKEAYDDEYRKQFIQHILAVFPNHPHSH